MNSKIEWFDAIKKVFQHDFKLEPRVAVGSHDVQIAFRYSIYNSPVVCGILHPLFEKVKSAKMYNYDIGK